MTSETQADPILSALCWYGSHEMPDAFLDIFLKNVPEYSERCRRFWPYVAQEWASFDRIPHRDYALCFRTFRPGWSADCMEPEARRFYDSLPPMITLYRGADRQSGRGLAWTLDMETARGFAKGHRGFRNPNPAIFKTRVRKSSVAFVCVDRGESECVLFRLPRRLSFQEFTPHHGAGSRAGRNPA
jgi:hypothetical protein